MSGPTRDSRGVSRTRNVLANWGAYLFAAIANFFLSPFVVHSLGDVSYGVWVLLGSLVGYLGLLDLGVRGAVTRYIARFHTKNEHVEASRVASSALAIFAAAGLLAIILSGVVAIMISDLFQIPDELVGIARIVVLLGGVNVAVSLVSGVYGGVVVGLQRFDLANIVEILVGLARVLAIVVALKAGFGLVALAIIQLVMSVIRGLASFVLSRRLYPELRAKLTECRRNQLARIFTFSISVLLLQASGMLILFSDSVVIGAFLPVSMITFFAIASNLVEYARAPISGISHTLTPWASSLEAGDDQRQLERINLAGARISTLIVLPIVITFMMRGGTFVGLWMGPEYAQLSGKVLWILAMALAFAVGYQSVVATMMGISKHNGLVLAFIIEALCNIGLSVLWVREYGIIGVAWGTTAPRLIASIFFAPWYVRRILGTTIPRFWLEVWCRPIAALVPFAVGSYVLERWWQPTGLIVFFAQVALALPLAAIGAWVGGLHHDEKETVLSAGILRRWRGRTGA